jgi:two-component system cell cycle sensor histidine kinase PleC
MKSESPPYGVRGIVSVWSRLVTPSPSIIEPYRRRQARLLAIFHLLIVPLGLVVSLYNLILPDAAALYTREALPQFVALSAILLCTYFICRTARFEWSAAIAFSAVGVHLFLSVALRTTTIDFEILYFLPLLILLFSLFFPLKYTFVFVLINIGALLALPYLMGEPRGLTSVIGPVIALVIAMGLIWLVFRQRDLLERERHHELASSQELMRLITDNVSDIVTHLDANGVIRYMSPSLQTLLGYPGEMAVGHSYHTWLARVHPDDTDRVAQTMADFLKTGNPILVAYRIQHADGHFVWMEPVATSLYTVDGVPNGMILVTRDITKRKEAEAALQASEAKFRALSDTIEAGITITQGDKTLYVNPAAERWFGYSAEELKSIDRTKLVHPDSMPDILALQEAWKQGTVGLTRLQVKVFHKDGGIRWIYMSSNNLEYEGQPALITTFFDITENKLAEEQRLELALEREKLGLLRQFIGDLSHDLRNPLAVMSTSVYLMNKALSDEKRQYHGDVVAAQMTHLEKVLEDLMNISQLEKDGTVFSFRPLDLNQLVEKVVQEYQPTADAKKQTFIFTPASEVPQVMAEQQQLSRALSNVISNALSYTPLGGEISVQTRLEEGRAEILILDNGIGIQSSDLPHVFEHFYRADKARSTETGGAGLGLTIARRIILSHSGKIDVQSTFGGGSLVTVSLPLYTPEL